MQWYECESPAILCEPTTASSGARKLSKRELGHGHGPLMELDSDAERFETWDLEQLMA